MNGDLSLSQALGGLRIANIDDDALGPDDAHSSSATKPPIVANSLAIDPRDGRTTVSTVPHPSHSSHSTHTSRPETLPGKTRPSTSDASVPDDVSSYPAREPGQMNPTRYHQTQRVPTASGSSGGTAIPRRTSRSRGGASGGGGTGGGARAGGSGGSVGGPSGGYTSQPHSQPYAGDAPMPTTSEEWKDRGAAVGMRREIDANGRPVIRQIKKGVRDFSFGRVLGEGSYSTVYLATDRQTLKEYAIKVLEKRHIIKEKKIKYVNIEKNTLNRLTEHPGIVRLYYTFQDETSLYYVLDLCSGGELLGVLKRTITFDVECTRYYGAQILDAIDYMHSRGIIHRDLKPENVLLDDQMHVKITDFGTAKLLSDPRDPKNAESEQRGGHEAEVRDDEDERAASFVGTAEYVSPELLTHKNACKASDLWAFGCIIYQLLAGRPPFKAGSEYLTFQKIVSLEYEFPQGFPSAARDLVERCLVLDPTSRLTVEHIKNHEFFEGQQFGKFLWRSKAPRLRPYIPPAQEPNIIQLNNFSTSSNPNTRSQSQSQAQAANASNGSSRPARIITELPPPTQLDIEWSPVLTRTNERILKLGDLMVVSTPLFHGSNVKGSDEGHRKLSRFFGGSTTKKRQRLVMVTTSGRVLLAPAGGEEKRAKQELSLLSTDASWKSQQDAKGQIVWCLDTGGQHFTFEEPKTISSSSPESSRTFAEEWIESLDRARDLAMSQNTSSDNAFADMSSAVSSPSSTLGGRSNCPDGFGSGDRSGRNHLSKSQASLEDSAAKRNRFSKRQSRNGAGPAF